MQDRMPSPYVRALKLPLRSPLDGEQLHDSVLDAALSYYLNYELIFPEMNHVPMLIQLAKQLALPGKQLLPMHPDCANNQQWKQ